MDNFNNVSATSSGSDGGASSDNFIDGEDTKEVKEAKSNLPEPTEFEYTERDVLLYNLGVGAKADELQWTYENSDGFQVCCLSPSAVLRRGAVLECLVHYGRKADYAAPADLRCHPPIRYFLGIRLFLLCAQL